MVFKSLPLTGMETVMSHVKAAMFCQSFQIITPNGDGNQLSLPQPSPADISFQIITPNGDGNLSLGQLM